MSDLHHSYHHHLEILLSDGVMVSYIQDLCRVAVNSSTLLVSSRNLAER